MTDSIPTWTPERNERFAAERLARDQAIADQGLRAIWCTAVFWPSRNIRLVTTTIGKTFRYAIVNPPEDFLRYGINCVLLGKDSRLVEDLSTVEEDCPVITVLGRLS